MSPAQVGRRTGNGQRRPARNYTTRRAARTPTPPVPRDVSLGRQTPGPVPTPAHRTGSETTLIVTGGPAAPDLPKGGAAKDGGSLADQVAKKLGGAR
jgi:hypothetical protein